MKKIFSFLAALLLVSFSAKAAISITLIVDDPARYDISYYDQSYNQIEPDIVAGANVLTFDWIAEDSYSGVSVSIYPKSDYKVQSLFCVTTETEETIYGSGASLYVLPEQNGYVYRVTSVSYEELRTAKATFIVDNPDKVTLNRGYSAIELVQGENVVSFIPEGTDAERFTVSASIRNSELYQVTADGKEVVSQYGNYNLTDLKDGSRVEIVANFPDKDVKINFVAEVEGSEGFINSVLVDNQPVENFSLAEGLTLKLGQLLTINGNTLDYNWESAQMNSTTIAYWSNPYNFFVKEEGPHTFTFKATPYALLNFTVNVDHPERITLYKGSKYQSITIPLVAGENKLTISAQAGGIAFEAAAGYLVTSFTAADGTEYKATPSYSLIPVKEGDVFTITTYAPDRVEEALIYIDEPALATGGGIVSWYANDNYDAQTTAYSFQAGTNAPQIQAGYNPLVFDATFDNPLNIAAWNADHFFVYLNDVQQVIPEYYSSVQFAVADGDIVKVFLRAEPDTFAVSFSVADDCAACAFEDVVRDQIVPVADLANSIDVLTGTEISFRLAGTEILTANGAELTPDEDGVYTLHINANTTLVAGSTPTAIDHVDTALNTNVYTLQGVLLIREATPAQINALPAGLYIINGQTTYLLSR